MAVLQVYVVFTTRTVADDRRRVFGQSGVFKHLSIICAAVILALVSLGCLPGVGHDSWQHYQNGGMFDTRCVSLSPDGQYLAYASACTGHGDIYVIKNGARNRNVLTDSEDFESSPIFTPDGRRIVYVRENKQGEHVWIVNSDGVRRPS